MPPQNIELLSKEKAWGLFREACPVLSKTPLFKYLFIQVFIESYVNAKNMNTSKYGIDRPLLIDPFKR